MSFSFDPNGVGMKGKLFGMPANPDQAKVVVLPVPWNVTASYGKAAVFGPRAVLNASDQLDLSLPGIANPWELGIHMPEISGLWQERSEDLSDQLKPYIEKMEKGARGDEFNDLIRKVNAFGEEMNDWVEADAQKFLGQGRIVGVLGGEHSVPFGLVRALSGQSSSFGILQIDAHADLRRSYQGFRYSHASIMDNLLQLPAVSRLVQVGIRDYSPSEWERITADPRIRCHLDADLKAKTLSGGNWRDCCSRITDDLPEEVYISFDIDGLDPALCPATGTPVPGGLTFDQADYLLRFLVSSGRKILGFDLCEVGEGPGDWDGNVGARLLYRLAVYAAASKGIVQAEFKV